jgi:Uma2 family endonuclease
VVGALIFDFVQINDLGRTTGSRVAYRLSRHRSPEPDIAFVRKSREHLIEDGYVDGPPDLAVEIVSPDSKTRDYVTKREQYEQAGVKEYWIVDELQQRVTLLRLGRQGHYREVKAKQGILKSRVLKGFWLRPDWLWQKRLPLRIKVLKEILGEHRET